MDYYDYIQHAGTKGMKWGQRLYQNKDGSLTPLGRVRYGVSKNFRTTVKRQQAAKKAREAKEEKKHHEENRQKAIKSGSASDVLKFKGEFTKAEMDSIAARLTWEKNMRDISDKEISSGKTKTAKLFEKIGKATNYAETGLKAYNTLANIYNGVTGDHVLPKIDTNITNSNIDQRKKSKKEKQKQQEAEAKRKQQEAEGPAKRAERAKKKAEQEAAEKAKSSESKKTEESKTETWTGTVEGEGTSKGSQTKNTQKSKSADYYDPIDMDAPVSNLPAVYRSSGQSWIAGYLEDLS